MENRGYTQVVNVPPQHADAKEWNVIHAPAAEIVATPLSSLATRSFICAAALLVKVTARMLCGGTLNLNKMGNR